MVYTSRYDGPELTPEERDVRAALRDYTVEGGTREDWTPTHLLYGVYRRWYAEHRWRFEPDGPDRLTLRQFGRALRRIFPDVERCYRNYRRGKGTWGYCYLLGPESIRSEWMDEHAALYAPQVVSVSETPMNPVGN